MFMVRVIAVGALAAWSALRGQHRFPATRAAASSCSDTQQCIQCHSLKGSGGSLAPDLAKRIDRNYTPDRDGQPDVESRPGDVGRDEEAEHRASGSHDSRTGGRPVRLLRLGALLRTARRCRPRQAGLRREALRRLPRHHRFEGRRRAAGREMGIAGRPGGPGAADVESRRAR